MTKISRRKQKKRLEEGKTTDSGPWLSMRTGLITNLVISVGIGLFVGWQFGRALGLGEGILWGAIAGGSIWLMFLFSYLFNRLIRGRRD
jgi:hypothetical protein